MDESIDMMENPINDNLNPQYIKQLRVALIGNKDLKYEILVNEGRVKDLVENIKAKASKIFGTVTNGDVEFDEEDIQHLEDEIMVIKLLLSFIQEFTKNKKARLENSLSAIGMLIPAIADMVSIYVGWRFDRTGKLIGLEVNLRLVAIINASLDIVLSMSHYKFYDQLTEEKTLSHFWKFVTSTVILFDEGKEITDFTLIKLLDLVPILLTYTHEHGYSRSYYLTALVVMIDALGSICKKLFLSASTTLSRDCSEEYIESLGYLNPRFPNFEITMTDISENINILLFTALTTACAQIFSMKRNDDILLHDDVLDYNALHITSMIYYVLLLMTRSNSVGLNLASVNLIFFYLSYRNQLNNTDKAPRFLDNDLIYKNFTKLLPTLIEMVIFFNDNHEAYGIPPFLYSPSKILADLGSLYPIVCDEMRKTNFDFCVLDALETQFKSNEKLENFKKLKQASTGNTKLVDFSIMKSQSQTNEINNLADTVLLLSVYTSTKEEYRTRIVSFKGLNGKLKSSTNSLPQILFELCENYKFLISQLQILFRILCPLDRSKKVAKADLPWFSENLTILMNLLNDPLYTNVLYFARSLSRSVALLRTFFVDCNSLQGSPVSEKQRNESSNRYSMHSKNGAFVHNIVQILKGNENSDKIIKWLQNGQLNVQKDIKKTQMLNKSITLCLLANFVLDFSSLRYKIVNDEGFLKCLAIIFRNSMAERDKSSSEDERFQLNTVQLSVLQILKNYMYNENQENKKDLVKVFPVTILFDKILYDVDTSEKVGHESIENKKLRLQQKIVCFDILRNLTAGSPYFSRYLSHAFETHRSLKPNIPSWPDLIYGCLTTFTAYENNSRDQFHLTEQLFYKDSFLLRMLDCNDYVSLVLAINYIEDHKYTNIQRFRKELLPKEKILRVWKRFLMLDVKKSFEEHLDLNAKININNNLNCIKLSIVWIIINLTWKNDVLHLSLKHKKETPAAEVAFDEAIGTERREDRIDVDLTEDSEAYSENEKDSYSLDDQLPHPAEPQDSVLSTAQGRARMLKDYGFLDALDSLLVKLGHNSAASDLSSSYSGKRFDYFMSNDLLEKIKTAQYQIASLHAGKIPNSHSSSAPYGTSIVATEPAQSQRSPSNQNNTYTLSSSNVYGNEYDSNGSEEVLEESNDVAVEQTDDLESFDEYWLR